MGPILVTGASGFLGRHLLTAWKEQGGDVPCYALVRDVQAWDKMDWVQGLSHVQAVKGEITDSESLGQVPEKLSGIFHLAGLVRHSKTDRAEVFRINVDATLNMVRLAAKTGARLVFVSTSGTVGAFDSPDGWADENSPFLEDTIGGWPYYASKLEAEIQGRALADELGVEFVVIRPPVMLGPGDHRFRTTDKVIRFLRKKFPFLPLGGINFIDVRDAAHALVQAMKISTPKTVYHLPGKACSIEEFYAMIEAISNVPLPRFRLSPGWAQVIARTGVFVDRFRPWKKSSLLPDPVVFEMASKFWGLRSLYAADDLGFISRDPRVTLYDTVHWLKEHYAGLEHLELVQTSEAPAEERESEKGVVVQS